MTNRELQILANKIRKDIVQATYSTGKSGAHIGGSLSCADIMAVLYGKHMRIDALHKGNRDRFIMSKGHAALAQYCTLKEMGVLTQEELDTFDKDGSEYVAHVRKNESKGLDFSGGSLGLGMSFATGVALACKQRHYDNHIYVLLGDGECNEGIVWEAFLFAAHNHLNNLTIIVDYNHLQADGAIEDIVTLGDLRKKMDAFSDNVHVVDGHNVQAIDVALSASTTESPKIIIAETIKGKGVSFIENKYNWHHGSLNDAKYNKAMAELIENERRIENL